MSEEKFKCGGCLFFEPNDMFKGDITGVCSFTKVVITEDQNCNDISQELDDKIQYVDAQEIEEIFKVK